VTTRFRYSWLFDAAPLIDVGLPGDVTAEHAALLRLQAHTLAPARDPAAEERAAVDRLLAAARSGDDLPGRVDESWRDDQRDRDAAAAALAQARAEQAGRLNDLVLDRRDTLIGALNPVLAELVDATAEVAPHLDPAQPMRPVDVARASNTVRKSVVKGEELAARFGAVRDTWGRLFGLPPTAKQQAHVPAFAVVRRADRLIGQDRHGRPVGRWTGPWPADNLPRLLWLAAHRDLEPWLPTPNQLDDAVREVYAEGIANAERARATRAAVGAWAG